MYLKQVRRTLAAIAAMIAAVIGFQIVASPAQASGWSPSTADYSLESVYAPQLYFNSSIAEMEPFMIAHGSMKVTKHANDLYSFKTVDGNGVERFLTVKPNTPLQASMELENTSTSDWVNRQRFHVYVHDNDPLTISLKNVHYQKYLRYFDPANGFPVLRADYTDPHESKTKFVVWREYMNDGVAEWVRGDE